MTFELLSYKSLILCSDHLKARYYTITQLKQSQSQVIKYLPKLRPIPPPRPSCLFRKRFFRSSSADRRNGRSKRLRPRSTRRRRCRRRRGLRSSSPDNQLRQIKKFFQR